MPSFFIVRTAPQCEERVRRSLAARSFDVLLLLTRYTRRDRVIERPLLARTLLVADDGRGIDPIRQTSGVVRVVHRGNQPVRLPQSLVNRLLKREDDDGFVMLRADDPGVLRPMDNETRATLFTAMVIDASLGLPA